MCSSDLLTRRVRCGLLQLHQGPLRSVAVDWKPSASSGRSGMICIPYELKETIATFFDGLLGGQEWLRKNSQEADQRTLFCTESISCDFLKRSEPIHISQLHLRLKAEASPEG